MIMIVDDDADIREVLEMILYSEGYPTCAASNEMNALTLLNQAKTPPSMIILDLQMPVMSGDEFLVHLRTHSNPTLRNIPVMIITASGKDTTELGVNEHLTKPFDARRFLQSVQKHCTKPTNSPGLFTSTPMQPQISVSG